MLETLGGLPAHPLVVHLPVVLVPLAAIGAILLAVRPKWLRPYGVVVTVMAGLGFLGALLAASTGEELEDTFVSAGETISGTLRDHAEMGETVQVLVGVFFVLMLGWVLFAWWRRRVGEDRATTDGAQAATDRHRAVRAGGGVGRDRHGVGVRDRSLRRQERVGAERPVAVVACRPLVTRLGSRRVVRPVTRQANSWFTFLRVLQNDGAATIDVSWRTTCVQNDGCRTTGRAVPSVGDGARSRVEHRSSTCRSGDSAAGRVSRRRSPRSSMRSPRRV